jgi:anti-anti-sigma factor
MQVNNEDDCDVLRVRGPLDESVSDHLREIFDSSLREENEISVDLSQVTVCDLGGLQLLCAAHKTATSGGKSFRVVRPSHTVLETSSALGLQPAEFGYCPES